MLLHSTLMLVEAGSSQQLLVIYILQSSKGLFLSGFNVFHIVRYKIMRYQNSEIFIGSKNL